MLKHLLSIDFKNRVDLLSLINLEQFALTENEENAQCTVANLLKLIKIMMYKIGIQDEKHTLSLSSLKTEIELKIKETA